MANPNKVFESSMNNKDFNLLLFFFLFVSTIYSFFIAIQEIQSGTIGAGVVYSFMLIVMVITYVIALIVLSNDNTLKPITNFIKIPLSTNLPVGSFFYLAGFGLPIAIQLIGKLFSGDFDFGRYSVPLFSGLIEKTFGTVLSAELASDMGNKIFFIMFDAGTIEGFTYHFIFVLAGILIALLFWKLWFDTTSKTAKLLFVKVFGIYVIPITLFVLSHFFNKSYTLFAFFVAGAFLFIANFSIYEFGIYLLFWIGFHQSHNLMNLILQDGFKAVAEGFISPFGIVFIIFMISIIFYVMRKRVEIGKFMRKWLNA